MSGTDELYPPAQYGWGWLVLALGILAALALAGWLVVFLTRPRRRMTVQGQDSQSPSGTSDVLSMLRTEYYVAIDRIESELRDGTIDARTANVRLSRTVRSFVNEYSGLEAPVLALDDLIRLGVHPTLIEAVHRHYYPGIFRRDAAANPDDGIEAARKVVAMWH
ncbi:hypothetical protein HD600_001294 [Microbacterium ginsengiterrae]|uniref:Uncharacterized protein n=1 Tax=Microbacterium ginsengiterrae TaxID=546115 RepID=A0A7W9FB52_9MICO|nr:hypothetical protein [Microbacterium ginsengiterrae]MBB5742797.1 hypothetical protein [Microbacterium ginsengiterrae]